MSYLPCRYRPDIAWQPTLAVARDGVVGGGARGDGPRRGAASIFAPAAEIAQSSQLMSLERGRAVGAP